MLQANSASQRSASRPPNSRSSSSCRMQTFHPRLGHTSHVFDAQRAMPGSDGVRRDVVVRYAISRSKLSRAVSYQPSVVCCQRLSHMRCVCCRIRRGSHTSRRNSSSQAPTTPCSPPRLLHRWAARFRSRDLVLRFLSRRAQDSCLVLCTRGFFLCAFPALGTRAV